MPDKQISPAWPERVGPFNDCPDVAASCASRARERPHSLQDSDHDTQFIYRRYWRTRRRLGRGDDGDTKRDVIALGQRSSK